MTLPRFFFVFIPGVVILVALLFPLLSSLTEATALELKGASLFLAVAGLLTVSGGLLAVWGAIKNNREQTELILGMPDAFCQLTVYHNGRHWSIATHHRGSSNVYDLQVVIRELTEEGKPVTGFVRGVFGTLTSETSPWTVYPLEPGWPTANSRPRFFQAQVTQRNGTGLQAIVIRPKPGGRIELGFLRLEFNRKSYEDPQFDRLQQALATGVLLRDDEIDRIRQLWRAADPWAWP